MNDEVKNLQKIKKEDFLLRNNLTDDNFMHSRLSWEELLNIGKAHAGRASFLKDTAILLSSVLQQGNEVHSVRWRVKDPEHLMAKIIRKRIDGSEKYNAISDKNYTEIVTDLIGIRVLHLFKKDWQVIHNFITSMWQLSDEPIVYIREGDDSESEEYSRHGCSVKVHKAGYRSVHYITTTRPMRDEIFTEIQVRTIFEEGWSEIDHRVRYPNFSDNKLLNYFLMIFNRFSGSADEMGSFVLELREAIELMELSKDELTKIENEKAESLQKIDDLISKLSSEEEKVGQVSNELQELKDEIKALKRNERITLDNNPFKSLDFLKVSFGADKLSKEMHDRISFWNRPQLQSEVNPWMTSTPLATTQLITDSLASLVDASNIHGYKTLTEDLGKNALSDTSKTENIGVQLKTSENKTMVDSSKIDSDNHNEKDEEKPNDS